MNDYRYIPIKGKGVFNHIFRIQIERDGNSWTATCPALARYGAFTVGKTRQEAASRINRIAQMIVTSLIEKGEPIPGEVLPSQDLLVLVSTGW